MFKKKARDTRRNLQAHRNSSSQYKKQPVYSYRSSRKESERQFNRGKSEDNPSNFSLILLKFTKILVGLVVAIGVLYFQSLTSEAKIKIVNSDFSTPRATSVYKDTVKEHLGNSKLNLSKFTFDTSKVTSEIKTLFPEVENVNIKIPLFQHQPVFEITLAKPIATLVTSDKTYFLDEQGRALFSEADLLGEFSRQGLIVVNDGSSHDIALGKPALTGQQIEFIKEVEGQAKNKGLVVQSLVLSNGGSGINVKFEDASYIVKFSFLAEPRQSAGAYLAIRNVIISKNLKPKEYVDVRIPERAYIK